MNTPQYPPSIKNRLAFQAWYGAGRKITDEVLSIAKRRDRGTVARWKLEQGWETFADFLDSKTTEVIAEATLDRVAIAQQAKERFQDECLALVSAAGALCGEMVKRMLARASVGGEVSYFEFESWMRSFATYRKTGESVHGIEGPAQHLSVSGEVGVSVTVTAQELGEIKNRLAPLLKEAAARGITIDVDGGNA